MPVGRYLFFVLRNDNIGEIIHDLTTLKKKSLKKKITDNHLPKHLKFLEVNVL